MSSSNEVSSVPDEKGKHSWRKVKSTRLRCIERWTVRIHFNTRDDSFPGAGHVEAEQEHGSRTGNGLRIADLWGNFSPVRERPVFPITVSTHREDILLSVATTKYAGRARPAWNHAHVTTTRISRGETFIAFKVGQRLDQAKKMWNYELPSDEVWFNLSASRRGAKRNRVAGAPNIQSTGNSSSNCIITRTIDIQPIRRGSKQISRYHFLKPRRVEYAVTELLEIQNTEYKAQTNFPYWNANIAVFKLHWTLGGFIIASADNLQSARRLICQARLLLIKHRSHVFLYIKNTCANHGHHRSISGTSEQKDGTSGSNYQDHSRNFDDPRITRPRSRRTPDVSRADDKRSLLFFL